MQQLATDYLVQYQAATLAAFQQQRAGETRLGETLYWPATNAGAVPVDFPQQLQQAKANGVQFVILGICEDIGPRANFGNGGADAGFVAFIRRFINLQANPFADGSHIWLLGEVDCADLQQQSTGLSASDPAQLAELRQLCAEIDRRAAPLLQAIFAAGLYPLVIGGGHNNALPMIQALAAQHGQPVNAINLDPHCDFRLLEGRHSGNGFSYAKAQGVLAQYYVLGLHELKNSATALQQLQQHQAAFCSYQDIYLRRKLSFTAAVAAAIRHFAPDTPLGIELDTDSISLMPVSAFTNCGISVNEAEYYVYQLASLPHSAYLHLAEAAPAQHPAGITAGMSEAGQVLTSLVMAFIQAKTAR